MTLITLPLQLLPPSHSSTLSPPALDCRPATCCTPLSQPRVLRWRHSQFDPTPFPPPNHQAIEVEGRPTRVHALAGAVTPVHEEWAIATIVPMPNLPVAFSMIREVLAEFLSEIKHKGFSETSPCRSSVCQVRQCI